VWLSMNVALSYFSYVFVRIGFLVVTSSSVSYSFSKMKSR